MQPPHPLTPRRRDGRSPLRTSVLLAASALVLALSSASAAAYAATGTPITVAGNAPVTATAVETAAASSATLTPTTTPTTFAVQPAGTSGGPGGSDPRPYFSYSATPSATFLDHAAIHNYSARPLSLTIYARDAFNTGDGGFDV
ncbi:MAG TPA: hypothetical protein VGS97_28640 [Actinocrinis sp.]|uniref:hypothetical protein n=1 Tax=Actinocrinis sp. TaxID=1920516 RepID=UPI002DDDBC55|nr:hypothetical protein [Actinocrinis sp.]HEV2348089.1 hypothetical protein [Actinocrinis sp.]